MDRADLLAVFYGEGPVPVLWATGCPVHFDVWLAFAQPPSPYRPPPSTSEPPSTPSRPPPSPSEAPSSPSEPPPSPYRQDLILSVREEHGVERALERLQRLRLTRECRPVAAGSFVAVRMTLEELVRALLPLTSLAGVVRVAHELAVESGAEGMEAALHGHIRAPATSEIHDSMQRRQERGRQLTWFLNLLRRVVADSHPGERDVTGVLVRMLAAAVPDTHPVRGPHTPVGRVVDRRQKYPVVSVTTNRRATRAVVRSRRTIKADAAEQVFSVDSASIGWAVVDSGIDARHSAFHEWDTGVSPPRRLETRIARSFDFTCVREKLPDDALINGLVNWSAALPSVETASDPGPPSPGRPDPYVPPGDQHGTHIAGIIGGWWPELEFRGICPRVRLYDFRVLDDDGEGDEFSIVTALQAVRHINEQAGRFVIAGVNISLSVPHDVAAHSTGWTPVCVECDRLTRSGVVVVTAAGNSGFTGTARTLGTGYHDISISDPGNAESVITVGSTHRSNPHRHGVSYFSGRGPTGDGRRKPDLVAPGEDIDGPIPGEGIAAMHGTSQAAAHVSGAAAMLLARYRELLGRPERVKQILCATATDLDRERDFQGHGLVDVLRAMQSV
ncbi:S8 family serine peptidase [Streptomyces sp. TG1A-60]|uniref:S8 family serine peptidase n=1 Tax=Streptomyces sp. TG1A-60 TaxID=3129111 RepID=UPI0030CC14ED